MPFGQLSLYVRNASAVSASSALIVVIVHFSSGMLSIGGGWGIAIRNA